MPVVRFIPLTLAAICLAALWRDRTRVRGTTLGPVRWWTAGGVVFVGAVCLVACLSELPPAPWRYAAGATTFCPLMALLGARRPQDKGWIFVVLTFWVILLLPAFEVWVARPGQVPEAAGARSILLLALLAVTVGNGAATPSRLAAATLQGIGQWLLISPWLAFLSWEGNSQFFWGVAFWSAGVGWGLVSVRGDPDASPFQRIWRAYRERFGGLWSLRLAERMNAYWGSRGSTHRLRLSGLQPPESGYDIDDEHWRAFGNLLRRFVDSHWIASVTGEHSDEVLESLGWSEAVSDVANKTDSD